MFARWWRVLPNELETLEVPSSSKTLSDEQKVAHKTSMADTIL